MKPRRGAWVLVGAAALVSLGAEAPRDPQEAVRQYRVARRLVAERSPEAATTLRRAYELDPAGPLADDALLDQAMLLGLPTWPEDLGRMDGSAAGAASELLARLVRTLPGSDRAAEARLRLGLLLLEPLPGRDPGKARIELLAAAASRTDVAWEREARYAAAWADESEGEFTRARDAYHRLVHDHPSTEAAVRARIGLARLALLDGRYGEAASLGQDAIVAGADPSLGAAFLRELAVRSLLRGKSRGGRWTDAKPARIPTGLEDPSAIARWGSEVYVADAKAGAVLRLDPNGQLLERWALEGVQAVAVDPMGRAFAAAGNRIFRLGRGGSAPVVDLGEEGPASGLAADAAGRLWILDRRGEQVLRFDPGARAPAKVHGVERGGRFAAIAGGSRRIVLADSRAKQVVQIASDGTARPAAQASFERPVGLAVDPAGQIAVLDSRADAVILLGPGGDVRERLPLAGVGIESPAGLALGADGSLDILDGKSRAVVRVP